MPSAVLSRFRESFGHLWAWSRVRYTLAASVVWGLILTAGWESSTAGLLTRTILIGLVLMLIFGFFERWPANPPRWLARWVLQVAGVALAVPFVVMAIYVVSTAPDQPPFYQDESRMIGYSVLTGSGILLAPWVAMSALLRARDEAVRSQAVAFERVRGELERQALDARLRLLQAQVQPHFLFNTLANVRELVDAGSPQAPAVLNSLIAYLRAAVPRLNEPATTLGQELELVRAYLELMHMRMPDRLQFEIHADEAAHALRCPPMTLLTLVENAVRHGIDPGEEGGRIEVRVRVQGGRCRAQVIDTGVGLKGPGEGLGTGLSTLRERLELTFGGDAHLRLVTQEPRGVRAEVDFPVRPVVA